MPAYAARRFSQGREPRREAYDVASIYASGHVAGEMFDMLDVTTIFSDRAGTVPAVVEDPVGRVVGSLGTTYLTTSSDTMRPLLKQDALGRYYLETVSSDALSTPTVFTLAAPTFMLAVLSKEAQGSLFAFGVTANADNRFQFANVSSGLKVGTQVETTTLTAVTSSTSHSNTWPLNEPVVFSALLTAHYVIYRVSNSGGRYSMKAAWEANSVASAAISFNTLTPGSTGSNHVMKHYASMVAFGFCPTPDEWTAIHGTYSARFGIKP